MDELLELAKQQGSLVLLLTLIIVTGARGLWVWGWQYKEALARAAYYQSIVHRQFGLIDKAVTVAQQQVFPPP